MRARTAGGCGHALAKRLRAVTECRNRLLKYMVVAVVMVVELVVVVLLFAVPIWYRVYVGGWGRVMCLS